MNIKFQLIAILSIILLNYSFAQDSKNTVILLNTEPVRVDLATNGDIKAIYGIEEGFLADFIIEKNEFDLNLVEKPINPEDIEGYKIVFVPTIDVKFDEEYATLNSGNISKLDYVVNEVLRDQDKKLIIRNPVSDNAMLSKNRLKAIMTYLTIKGVSRGLIIVEERDDNSDLFEINIVK
jgi:hypothetical protein